MRLALVGNQNCGKSTLFNRLTGAHTKVGNFPGVTVEKHEGPVRDCAGVSVVDLPGTYSLLPLTEEERVTRDFLRAGQADGIINLIDARALDRGLYLTLELMQLAVPMAVALNLTEELRRDGGQADAAALSARLGVPVVEVDALTGAGVGRLVEAAIGQVRRKARLMRRPFQADWLNRLSSAVLGVRPEPFGAAMLLSAVAGEAPSLPPSVAELVRNEEKRRGVPAADAMVDDRYRQIGALCSGIYRAAPTRRLGRVSLRIDRVAVNRIAGIPIFILVMLGVFYLSFSVVGGALSGLAGRILTRLAGQIDALLLSAGASAELRAFMTDGVLAGIGSVMSFLPTVIVLFLLLSLLEDCGYMARVAYLLDRPFRGIGLSGRFIVPMLLGLGCSVPAMLSARTVGTAADRKRAALLVPFISCSARLPVYVVFSGAFFGQYAFLAVALLYFLGIAAAVLYAAAIAVFNRGKTQPPFVMELPDYRFPSLRNVLSDLSLRVRDFIRKVFSAVLLSSMAVWLLSRYTPSLTPAAGPDSLLAAVGGALAVLFRPLGFGDWRAATALLSGLIAKEAILSTLAVLTGCELSALPAVLPGLFTPAAALSFLTFTALYMPCAAALSVLKNELGSMKKTAAALAVQTAAAYLAARGVYLLLSRLGPAG